MWNNKYDYLVVGSGLAGAIFAYEANKRGYKVKVIDKRNHIGGNLYCENIEGINVHKYGAHIFHTSNKKVWDYLNQFVSFNNYINSPIAKYKDKIYNLPFNMNTFYQLWNTITVKEAKDKIIAETSKYKDINPINLQQQALKLVGEDIYYKLIKGYSEKQWNQDATKIPAFVIKRLPLRFTYDNNYFNDTYQGVVVGGYNLLFEKLLEGIEVELNKDFFSDRENLENSAKKIVFTGMIDKFFNYQLGRLNYRSLRFEEEILDIDNFQGNAVVNYTERDIPYTRIIEHKHFEKSDSLKTVISREYPLDYSDEVEPYYPINDDVNNEIYQRYAELSKSRKDVIFCGRLAEYKYYDMHIIVEKMLELCEKEFQRS